MCNGPLPGLHSHPDSCGKLGSLDDPPRHAVEGAGESTNNVTVGRVEAGSGGCSSQPVRRHCDCGACGFKWPLSASVFWAKLP